LLYNKFEVNFFDPMFIQSNALGGQKMFKYITATILCVFTLGVAQAQQEPASFKAFLKTEKDYRGKTHPGWETQGRGKVCEAMRSVGLSDCSYNSRVVLVDFLYLNGKVLFPCEGNTNPYFNNNLPTSNVGHCSRRLAGEVNNLFIGQAVQNDMLAKAIIANRRLFKNGDLTAAKAKQWK
jgi:hypothetical protein